MKSKMKILLVIMLFGSLAKAETHTMRVELATNQCVYIDGEKECVKGTNPVEELEFNLIKSSSGKYSAYQDMGTYVGDDYFKVTFTVTKENLSSSELIVKINLLAIRSSGEKNSKLINLSVTGLSDLEGLSFKGSPIERHIQHYLTVTDHSIKFY